MEKQALYIDPRTKLFLLLVMNIVMLDTSSGVLLPYLRFIIGFLPFVLLLTSKRFKPAWVYLVIYLISHIIVLYVLDYTSGFMMMLLGFLSSMGTKFLPGGMLGVYFFCSTRVNEFIASMERMHVSQKVIIPVSVMFRFFTTVKEEAEGISDAMRMRKLGFSYFFFKPVEILEYRLVPLMISVVNNVCFHYQEQKNASLTHVNLQINEGEVVVLCGESGCGKSTIIRLINGLIPYYYKGRMDGQVKVLGHLTQEGNIYNMGSKVSSVFQNPRSQFFCVDVKSELAFGAENLNYDKDEIIKRIEDASHELKFEYLLDRTMFQLSGGEKQKIACASVSITDNPIVVLDEPSSNLDMHAVTELKAMIRYWKQKGKTVVIAEHRFRYLKGIADRFIYMKKGKIVREFSSVEMQKLPAEELMSMGLRNLSYDNLEIQNYNEAKTFMRIHDFIFRYKGSKKLSLFIDEMDIPKASVIAIIGRNGAGKSTFVRSLCGLEKKAKGLLEDGNVMLKAKKRLNNSFLVMQDVNRQLFTESVEEEIILSMDEKNDNLLEGMLKEFDLYDYRKQHPMSLSGGQKQRVAVASAVASMREYIVFDEPTSGLDYFHMMQVAECIKKMHEKGRTIFLITHDLELIYSCCNYIIHIENGMIKELYQVSKENEPKLRNFFEV